MIFPCLEVESVLQVNDKTRLNAQKSFSSDNAPITLIRIRPEAEEAFIAVSLEAPFLDWQYDAEGAKVVTVEVTAGESTKTLNKTILVVTEANDALFSSDADLVSHEDDILRFVREGRSSFLDKHRLAQKLIVDHLDEKKLWDSEGFRLTKTAMIKADEVSSWSAYLTLSIIFKGISNAVDDIFSKKADFYAALAKQKADKAVLRPDQDGDGVADIRPLVSSSFVIRR